MANVLSDKEAALVDAYWRAANYLSIGQIYLLDNPLLKVLLAKEHIKPRLLGHWGTTPGLNFIYVHLNRLIKKLDLDMIYVAGPGHGGPGIVANAYLEGTYSEVYPNVPAGRGGDEAALHAVLVPRRDSEPCGAGDAWLHPRRRGARLFDVARSLRGVRQSGPHRRLRHRRRRSGDRAARHQLAFDKFLNPAHDGAVLPILHLNGYKIANPTVLARIPLEELDHLLRGYGYNPYVVEGDDPARMHELMAARLETVIGEICTIQTVRG